MAISTAILYEGLVTPVGWWSLALIPASCLFFYICFTINHNQLHLGMFRATPLNIAANILLSLCTGVPVTMIYLPHVQNHHPNPCNSKDWAGAHLVDGHQGLWRALIYIAKAQIAPMKMRPRSLFAGLNTYRKSSLCLEALALGIYIAYALYAHPVSFLLHNLLPWFLSMNALILMNFALHDGCDYESKLDHSLTFTTKIGNYFLLNNGYHLAHHEQPKMHWSKLPHYHNETVKPKARTEFEKVSILKHLRLMYFFIPKVAKNEVVAKKT